MLFLCIFCLTLYRCREPKTMQVRQLKQVLDGYYVLSPKTYFQLIIFHLVMALDLSFQPVGA